MGTLAQPYGSTWGEHQDEYESNEYASLPVADLGVSIMLR
jgi:hypothetical protein